MNMPSSLPVEDLPAQLTAAIRQEVQVSPLNRLQNIDGSPIWEEPLVGFADGDDPLFTLYKQVVGADHLTPREALAAGWPQPEFTPPARVTVISWVLPAAQLTRLENRAMRAGPALRWNHTRFQGEAFNDHLRRFVSAFLQERGVFALAPVLLPQFRLRRAAEGWGSTWSERHAAYAAGLGTFGLSDGLITARGMAVRLGSVVACAGWPASPRPYVQHQQYCLYVTDGSCGACMARCPVGAIGPNGHDKDRCRAFLFEGLADWLKKPGYIGAYGACGLCQTRVPCEFGIPVGGERSNLPADTGLTEM